MVSSAQRLIFNQADLKQAVQERQRFKGPDSMLLEWSCSKGKLPKDTGNAFYTVRFTDTLLLSGYRADLLRACDNSVVATGLKLRSIFFGTKVLDTEADVEIFLKLVAAPAPVQIGPSKLYSKHLSIMTFGDLAITEASVRKDIRYLAETDEPHGLASAAYSIGKAALAGKAKTELVNAMRFLRTALLHWDQRVRCNAAFALAEIGKSGIDISVFKQELEAAREDESSKAAKNAARAIAIINR